MSEAFEKGKRKALIVMATGTGKAGTTMALIDVFMRANQARLTSLRQLQSGNPKELDALRPKGVSVLDRVFGREL